jgi:hypothetical protein
MCPNGQVYVCEEYAREAPLVCSCKNVPAQQSRIKQR